jgi:hypothetical protein
MTTDRLLSIVLSRVAEDKDISVWRGKVGEVLKLIVGREVDVADTFNLCQFNPSKVRPVMVNERLVSMVWHKQFILKTARKLTLYCTQ